MTLEHEVSIDWQQFADNGWTSIDYPPSSDLLVLAQELGKPRSVRPDGPLVDRLIPSSESDAPKRSLSALYGLGAFPLHTDAAHHQSPPRLTMLRLAEPYRSTTATLLMDLSVALAGAEALLRTSTWLVSNGRRRFYASVLTGTAEGRRYRFDRGCMRPVSRLAAIADLQVADALDPSRADRVEWERGFVILLDNWRVAHAREASETSLGVRRVLERVLVEPFDGMNERGATS